MSHPPTVIEEAQQAMLHLTSLTSRLRDGFTPDPYAILACQSDLVRLHMQLGVEMSRKFGDKERAYLSRKVEQARQHAHGRRNLELTSKDAEERAFQEVRKMHEEEIDRMEEFELMRALMKSLQNAFEHSRSIGSYLKDAERNGAAAS